MAHEMTAEQIAAVATHVRRRRTRLALSVSAAAILGGVSPRVWHKVESGGGNLADRTLRRVALGLGESPQELLELAGFEWSDDEGEPPPDRLSALEAQVTVLAEQVARLLAATAPPES